VDSGIQDTVRFALTVRAEEALRRVAAALPPRGASRWNLFFQTGARGWVRGEEFRLHWRDAGWRNSFRPYLFGSVQDTGRGCVLTGRFGMHPLVKGFLVFWFAWAGLMFVISLLCAVYRPATGAEPVFAVVCVLFMASVPLLVLRWITRTVGVRHRRELTAFLERTCSGR